MGSSREHLSSAMWQPTIGLIGFSHRAVQPSVLASVILSGSLTQLRAPRLVSLPEQRPAVPMATVAVQFETSIVRSWTTLVGRLLGGWATRLARGLVTWAGQHPRPMNLPTPTGSPPPSPAGFLQFHDTGVADGLPEALAFMLAVDGETPGP